MLASRLRLTITLTALLVACGSSSSGGSGDCGECFSAVSCVAACGEDPVQVGCCPCPEGTFDDLQCAMDAGGGG